MLWVNVDWKSPFFKGWVSFAQNYRQMISLINHLYMVRCQWRPYNSSDNCFHTKKLSSRLSAEKSTFRRITTSLRFWTPLFWGLTFLNTLYGGRLKGNVRCSKAHWKAGSGPPISDNWTFFHGWGATNEYWLKIDVFEGVGQSCPKFQVEGDVPINHSFYQKK